MHTDKRAEMCAPKWDTAVGQISAPNSAQCPRAQVAAGRGLAAWVKPVLAGAFLGRTSTYSGFRPDIKGGLFSFPGRCLSESGLKDRRTSTCKGAWVEPVRPHHYS